MVRVDLRVSAVPLFLGVVYLLFSFFLFLYGPFSWPVDNEGLLAFFLFTVILAITFGFTFGVLQKGTGKLFVSWRFFYRLGAISSIVLLFPSIWVYTGKMPWEVWGSISDQGQAYHEMLKALEENASGFRAQFSFVRALFAPFAYCVIPFAILKFRELRAVDIVLLILALLSVLVFSLARGTDRETVDLVIFVLFALMISIGRNYLVRGKFTFSLAKGWVVLGVVVLFLSAAFLFLERKEQRMGGHEPLCVAEGVVCSDRQSGGDPLSNQVLFGYEMLAAYLSQGYYGLSLALDEDFTSTYGIGHSVFLMSAYEKIMGSELYQRSYVSKAAGKGWDDRAQWSTMFPWVASDVGFPLVPIVIGVLAFIWGLAWRSAVFNGSDAASIVFIFVSLSFLYAPANNQLAQTLDSYLAFLFWLLLWLVCEGFKMRFFLGLPKGWL